MLSRTIGGSGILKLGNFLHSNDVDLITLISHGLVLLTFLLLLLKPLLPDIFN